MYTHICMYICTYTIQVSGSEYDALLKELNELKIYKQESTALIKGLNDTIAGIYVCM